MYPSSSDYKRLLDAMDSNGYKWFEYSSYNRWTLCWNEGGYACFGDWHVRVNIGAGVLWDNDFVEVFPCDCKEKDVAKLFVNEAPAPTWFVVRAKEYLQKGD